MNEIPDIPKRTVHVLDVVNRELAGNIRAFQFRLGAVQSGYPVVTDWHTPIADGWGQFPQVPVRRAAVYRGNADTWGYSHHQTIAKWGDKYVVSWSNGLAHEDCPGQEVHCAWSDDGVNWSEPDVVVPTSLAPMTPPPNDA